MDQTLPFPKVFIDLLLMSRKPTIVILRAVIAAIILFMALFNVWGVITSLSKPTVYMKDFFSDYSIAWATLNGVDPYSDIPELKNLIFGSTLDQTNPHPSTHPPTIALFFMPLALMPYELAAGIWAALEYVFVIIAVLLISKVWARSQKYNHLLLILIFIFSWSPFLEEILLGQEMSLILALLTGSWLLLRKDKDIGGGILLGLAIAIKIIAWPLVLFLFFKQRWQAALSAMAVVALANILSGLLMGFSRVIDYYLKIAPTVSVLYRTLDRNRSTWTIGWRLFYGTGRDYYSNIMADPILLNPGLASAVSVAIPVLLLLVTLIIALRQSQFDLAFSQILVASILISPISWDFYLLLLVLPVAVIFYYLRDLNWPARVTNFAAGVGLLLYFYGSLIQNLLGLFVDYYGGIKISFLASTVSLLPTVILLLLMIILHRLSTSLQVVGRLKSSPSHVVV